MPRGTTRDRDRPVAQLSYGEGRDSRAGSVKHVFVEASERVNNRAENNHQPTRERERRTRGFRDPERMQAFLSSFGLIRQHFALKRHLLRASLYRKQLGTRFAIWHRFTESTQNPAAF